MITHPLPASSTISEVERDTGLTKDTLRAWERRYAFPQPLRDSQGERRYPAEQVRKLRLVKRLLDLGFRPGKVIGHSSAQLHALAAPFAARLSPQAPHPALQHCLALCESHQFEALRATLLETQMSLGLQPFVLDVAAPLAVLIGQAWAGGRLAVFEEHLCTEILQIVLRSAIFAQARQAGGPRTPRILLTTLPQERHGLGLLMAEALCTIEGAHCIVLGVQTPLPDIVAAARTQHADIVALSFSSRMNARQAIDGLQQLHRQLPADTDIWAGGSCAGLKKNPPDFVYILGLHNIAAIIAHWRERQAGLRAAPGPN